MARMRDLTAPAAYKDEAYTNMVLGPAHIGIGRPTQLTLPQISLPSNLFVLTNEADFKAISVSPTCLQKQRYTDKADGSSYFYTIWLIFPLKLFSQQCVHA